MFTDPQQIVITDRTAASLFGPNWASNASLLGSAITYNKTTPLVLAGVIREAPVNSHLQFDAILAYDPQADGNSNWLSNNYLTYIVLADGTDTQLVNEKLRTYINKY